MNSISEHLSGNESEGAPLVVMLTTDRQIDRRILLTADSLEKMGCKLVIIGMPSDGMLVADDPRAVRIEVPKEARREAFVLSVYRYVRSFLSVNCLPMRIMRHFAWRYFVDQDRFYTQLFYPTASRYRPDVVVANDLPMLPVAYKIAEASQARLVYDSHELFCEQEFSKREKQRWEKLERQYIGKCDAIITVNPSIATELEKRYGVRDVQVVYNAERTYTPLQASRYFHERFGFASNQKVLLLQGGLSAGRNLDTLVESMRHVNDPEVVLIILGDGLLKHKLEDKAQAVPGRIFFHPAVSQDQLLNLTASADAGVIPYLANCLNNYYCTPNKLFEFIAAGIPVLATDLPEIRKLVSGYEIGLVGETSSPDKLAQLIDDFFSNQDRVNAWTANIMKARKEVCWDVEEKKIQSIYGRLLKKENVMPRSRVYM